MTWLTLKGKPAPRHLVARAHTNPFVGPLVDTRCGLTNQAPGEQAPAPPHSVNGACCMPVPIKFPYPTKRPMKTNPHKPSEHAEQVAFIQYCALQTSVYPDLAWLYAIPNGGKRNLQVALKLKAEGAKAGVPDLCLPTARGPYHGLYMETKVKPNKPTPEQRAWITYLESQGYAAAVCYGCDELVETALWYLALEK